MCGDVVAPTTSSTPTSSSLPPVTPTPEVLYPLWGFTRYGRVSYLHLVPDKVYTYIIQHVVEC